jgi:hypothetical protein
MKRTILFGAMILLSIMSFAQKSIRLNAYGLYVFDDRFNSTYDPYNYYDGKIKAAGMYGGGIEFLAMEEYSVELIWLHENTTAPMTYQSGAAGGVKSDNFDLALNYIMLGLGRNKMAANGKVEVFGGIQLGVGLQDVESQHNNTSGSSTKFAWGARLGTNIWASHKVGLKLMAQLLSITQGAGGGLYFGTGGVGAGLTTYSTVYQFGLGGGLTFRLGN